MTHSLTHTHSLTPFHTHTLHAPSSLFPLLMCDLLSVVLCWCWSYITSYYVAHPTLLLLCPACVRLACCLDIAHSFSSVSSFVSPSCGLSFLSWLSACCFQPSSPKIKEQEPAVEEESPLRSISAPEIMPSDTSAEPDSLAVDALAPETRQDLHSAPVETRTEA